MKRLIQVLALITLFYLSASADSGGPDEFGYSWIDSNEPGGPVFEWIDVSSTGQIITGLDDDVCVGPFSIGFPFQFYWYNVNTFYIGSNGYIIFGDPANLSQPFPESIPLTEPPNDFIGAYIADWIPGQPGGEDSAYYWTNGIDSCVVSFINYPAYLTGGSHSFQIILCGADSTILCQYGEQQGLVLNNDLLIGIESQTGHIGLEHSHDQYIAFDNSAIQFLYPDNVTYEVRDLAAYRVVNNNSGGFFILNDGYFHPNGIIKNVGIQTEYGYGVSFDIIRETGETVYSQSITPFPAINPWEEYENYFLPMWIPTETGQYIVSLRVSLTEDVNAHNDTIRAECRVLELPGVMKYDDDSAELAWKWEGGSGGLAQRFIPPLYDIRLDTAFCYIAENGGTSPFTIQILDDSGEEGAPGVTLFSDDIAAPNAGWYSLNVEAENIIIEEGAFYVAWQMIDDGTPGLGIDQSVGQIGSRQAWEYTGLWTPFRQSETSDPMIRCAVSAIEPSNQPPMIVDYSPAYLDTIVGEAGDYLLWAHAFDPDDDPLSWEWRFEGSVISSDSFAVIPIYSNGEYIVHAAVSDAEFSDSLSWNINASLPGVEDHGNQLPLSYTLHPVHPNPFNPQTEINFELSQSSKVTLAVYDLSGREVITLLDTRLGRGCHRAVFGAHNLASGIYLISLEAGSFSAIQKAVLLK